MAGWRVSGGRLLGAGALCVAAVLAAMLALPRPGHAQEAVIDPATVAACFEATPRGQTDPDCIGAAADDCRRATQQTTIDISFCIKAEADEWDRILNREYGATRDHFAHLPSVQATLKEAQRAWIALRDADCALAHDRYDGGSMRLIAGGYCILDHTARRALHLKTMREY